MEAICPVSTLVPGLSEAPSSSPSAWQAGFQSTPVNVFPHNFESPTPIGAPPAQSEGFVFVTSTADSATGQAKDALRLVSSVETSTAPGLDTGSDSPLISMPRRPVSKPGGGGSVQANVPQGSPVPARPSTDTSARSFSPPTGGSAAMAAPTIRSLSLPPTAVADGQMSPMDASGGSGGGGTIASTYGAGTIGMSGGGTMVGSRFTAELFAPGAMEVLESVTWTVSGAASSQSYTVGLGGRRRVSPQRPTPGVAAYRIMTTSASFGTTSPEIIRSVRT